VIKAVTARHLGDVQQNLLLGLKVSFFSAIEGIFLTLLIARIIVVAAKFVGHRHIGLLDPSNNFIIELSLEGLRVLQDGPEVLIFSLKIFQDPGVVPLVQPIIIIDTCLAMSDELLGNFLGNGRLGTFG
jgi:hypothetical protein